VIPAHTHPADEYVTVLSGSVETGGRRCEAGTFWTSPAGGRQGPQVAITDVGILSVRLGPVGRVEESALDFTPRRSRPFDSQGARDFTRTYCRNRARISSSQFSARRNQWKRRSFSRNFS